MAGEMQTDPDAPIATGMASLMYFGATPVASFVAGSGAGGPYTAPATEASPGVYVGDAGPSWPEGTYGYDLFLYTTPGVPSPSDRWVFDDQGGLFTIGTGIGSGSTAMPLPPDRPFYSPLWLSLILAPSTDPLAGINSLAQAIQARYAADDFAAIAGPLFNNMAPPDAEPPMVVMSIRRGTPYLLTSTSRFFEHTVTLRIRSLDADAAHAAATRIAGAFDDQRFQWNGGYSGPATQAGWSTASEPTPSVDGQVHYDELTYNLRTQGPR